MDCKGFDHLGVPERVRAMRAHSENGLRLQWDSVDSTIKGTKPILPLVLDYIFVFERFTNLRSST